MIKQVGLEEDYLFMIASFMLLEKGWRKSQNGFSPISRQWEGIQDKYQITHCFYPDESGNIVSKISPVDIQVLVALS